MLLIAELRFLTLETKVEWVTYPGLTLAVLAGGATTAWLKNIRAGKLMGAITYLTLPESLKNCSSDT